MISGILRQPAFSGPEMCWSAIGRCRPAGQFSSKDARSYLDMRGFRQGLDSWRGKRQATWRHVQRKVPPDALRPHWAGRYRCSKPEEVKMLVHLPIVILAGLSPIAVSDAAPKFDIAKECRFESGTSTTFERCSRDETDAFQKLQAEWPQFTEANRKSCLSEATVAGFASYVELLICLEMARDVADEDKANSRGAVKKTVAPPTSPGQPELNIVDKRD
jgi:hypothetical protein